MDANTIVISYSSESAYRYQANCPSKHTMTMIIRTSSEIYLDANATTPVLPDAAGITIIHMTAKLDGGPWLEKRELPIGQAHPAR